MSSTFTVRGWDPGAFFSFSTATAACRAYADRVIIGQLPAAPPHLVDAARGEIGPEADDSTFFMPRLLTALGQV